MDEKDPTKPDPNPHPKPDPAKPDDKPAAKWTDADIEKARADAVADAERKAKDKAEKDRDAAERKAAAEEGKFKELADKETARAEAAEAKARKLELAVRVAAYVKDKPKLVNAAELIAALLPADVVEGGEDDAVKAAAARFEASLPEPEKAPDKKPSGAAPPVQQGRVLPKPSPEAARRRPFAATYWRG